MLARNPVRGCTVASTHFLLEPQFTCESWKGTCVWGAWSRSAGTGRSQGGSRCSRGCRGCGVLGALRSSSPAELPALAPRRGQGLGGGFAPQSHGVGGLPRAPPASQGLEAGEGPPAVRGPFLVGFFPKPPTFPPCRASSPFPRTISRLRARERVPDAGAWAEPRCDGRGGARLWWGL